MASTVKTLRAKLVADVSDFNKKMDGVAKRIDKTANKLRGLGTKLSIGITAPLLAVGFNAIKAAAKLDIMERKFTAVFGKGAKEARDFSKELAAATGRSSSAVRGMLASTQDLLTGFGVTTDEASDLSKQFNQLALDVASFQGATVSDEQAIKAFNSALTGETEALKTLGVVIKQADIAQELLNMGIEGGIKAATGAQKAQAVLNLIMGQTANAQGKAAEFARTLQGRMDGLTARFGDMSEELGNRLLPIAERFLTFLEDTLTAIDNMDEATKRQAVDFGIYAAAAGPALLATSVLLKGVSALTIGFLKAGNSTIQFAKFLLTSLVPAIAPVLAPLLAVGVAVGAMVTAFAVAKRAVKLSGIDIVATVKTMVTNIKGFLVSVMGPSIDFVKDAFGFFLDQVKLVVKFLSKIPGVSAAIEGFKNFAESMKTEVVGAAKFTAGFIEQSFQDLAEDSGPIFEQLVESFKTQMVAMLEAAGIEVPKIQAMLNSLKLPSLSGGGASPGETAVAGAGGAAGKGETAAGAGAGTGGGGGLSAFFKNLTKDVSATQLATDLASDSINSFADGLADAATSGESFGDTMKNVMSEVVKAIVKAIIKALILKALSGFGGVGAAVSAGTGAAGVGTSLQSGGRIPAGGFRPVGEAGMELAAGPAQIIPLSKLGGGGGNFNVFVENHTNAQVEVEDLGTNASGDRDMKLFISNTIAEDFSRGGNAARSAQQSFGLRPKTI